MLEALKGRASERKLRLYAVACARLVWDLVPAGLMRDAVEAAERSADGVPWEQELRGFSTALYLLPADGGGDWLDAQAGDERAVYFTVRRATGPYRGLCGMPGGIAWPEGRS
jgi:hypothetical protein